MHRLDAAKHWQDANAAKQRNIEAKHQLARLRHRLGADAVAIPAPADAEKANPNGSSTAEREKAERHKWIDGIINAKTNAI